MELASLFFIPREAIYRNEENFKVYEIVPIFKGICSYGVVYVCMSAI